MARHRLMLKRRNLPTVSGAIRIGVRGQIVGIAWWGQGKASSAPKDDAMQEKISEDHGFQ
ncbi:hypothetical protein [Stieleria bergensis]|uniref:hypothetical protein n=1 Tax=Stieleria bergensis TaxID=2528025 RepID=UPI003AF3ABFF